MRIKKNVLNELGYYLQRTCKKRGSSEKKDVRLNFLRVNIQDQMTERWLCKKYYCYVRKSIILKSERMCDANWE